MGTGDADPMAGRFGAAGLEYNRPEVVPNTRLALRLTELARANGLHGAFHDRLMDAYWAEAVNIGDPVELRRLASEVGLAEDAVERVIADDTAYLDAVLVSTREAQSVGINAIPAFVLDQRLIVLGAHPIETFRSAFAQLASQAS
jgi:predicted DsbA family dithiol-disulfide isomerase